jgi:hypothetical protein
MYRYAGKSLREMFELLLSNSAKENNTHFRLLHMQTLLDVSVYIVCSVYFVVIRTVTHTHV